MAANLPPASPVKTVRRRRRYPVTTISVLLGAFALASSCATSEPDADPVAATTVAPTTAPTTEPPPAEEPVEEPIDEPDSDTTDGSDDEDPDATGDTGLLVGLDVSVRELDCGEQLPLYVLDAIPGGADDPRLSCWAMDTPENASEPDGRRIEVTYYVWESALPPEERATDPIAYLPGGPRGSAYNTLRVVARRDLQGPRDFIMMDTRGNSPVPGDDFGLPQSACPEVFDSLFEMFALNESIEDEYAILTAGWQACVDRLRDDGWDLDQYNTRTVVDDLERLRLVLDIPVWNLYTESYSTMYGLHYLRTHPDSLRAVLLDSVTPPDGGAWTPAAVGQAVQDVFDEMVRRCADDPVCTELHPDPRADLDSVVQRLNEAPRQVDVTHELTGAPGVASIDGLDVAFGLGELLGPDTLISMPGILAGLADGDDGNIDASIGRLQAAAGGGLAVSGAVVCGDFPADRTMNGPADALATASPWEHLGYISNMPCEIVDVSRPPDGFNDPVTSDVPTLVLVGMLDTATPPADGLRTAERLSQVTLVVFEHLGHVPARVDDCARSIVVDFFERPDAADLTCVEERNTDAPGWG